MPRIGFDLHNGLYIHDLQEASAVCNQDSSVAQIFKSNFKQNVDHSPLHKAHPDVQEALSQPVHCPAHIWDRQEDYLCI